MDYIKVIYTVIVLLVEKFSLMKKMLAKRKAYVKNYLASKGIKYDTKTINNAIKAAVIEMEKSLLNE